jgi:hypothetical protein
MRYFPASVIAGIRRLLKFRRVRVILADRQLKTPLVFIGVGERELRLPALGQIRPQGHKGLHLIAVDCETTAAAFMLAMKSLLLGIDPLQKERRIENQLVDGIELNFRRHIKRIHISLDGEVVKLQPPLKFRYAPGEILVALPLAGESNFEHNSELGRTDYFAKGSQETTGTRSECTEIDSSAQ